MPTPEFPTYDHTKKTTGIGFPGESPTIGGNVSGANPQGSVTPIDWIPTNTGMAFTGNVAIGTDTPSTQYKLYVAGNSSVSSAATFGQNVYVVGIVTATKLFGDGSGLTNITGIGAGIQLKNNGTLVGSSGTVDFYGNVTVSIGAGSGIATVFIPNYWSITSVGINTLSNVGIGTTNPQQLLHVGAASTQSFTVFSSGEVVVGGISSANNNKTPFTVRGVGIGSTIPNILVSPNTGTNTAHIQFSNDGAGSMYVGRTNSAGKTNVFDLATTGYVDFIGNSGNLPLSFVTSSTEAMRIDSSQRVGIGILSPTSKLHVVGDVLVASGVVTATSLLDSKGDVRSIVRSTNTTVVASDAGKFLDVSAGVTINSSTAFNIGDAVTIFNNSAASITITATGITLRQAATSNTGSRTLAAYGLVTVLCVASNTYVAGGAGLT